MVKTRHLLVIKIQVPNLFLAYKILLSRSLISQVLFLFFFLLFEELSRVNFLVFFFFNCSKLWEKMQSSFTDSLWTLLSQQAN